MIAIKTENENNVCKMRIEGEMTIFSAEELKRQMLSALKGCAGLELDLTQVTELDTAGFQLLFAARRELSGSGRAFRISACSPAASSVLELFDMKLEGYN